MISSEMYAVDRNISKDGAETGVKIRYLLLKVRR